MLSTTQFACLHRGQKKWRRGRRSPKLALVSGSSEHSGLLGLLIDDKTNPLWRLVAVIAAGAAVGLIGYGLHVSPALFSVAVTVTVLYIAAQWLRRHAVGIIEASGPFRSVVAPPLEALALAHRIGDKAAGESTDEFSRWPNWAVDLVLGCGRAALIVALQVFVLNAWLTVGLPRVGALHWLTVAGAVALAYLLARLGRETLHRFAVQQANATPTEGGRALAETHARTFATGMLETRDQIAHSRGVHAATDASQRSWRVEILFALLKGAGVASANWALIAVLSLLFVSPFIGAGLLCFLLAVVVYPLPWFYAIQSQRSGDSAAIAPVAVGEPVPANGPEDSELH